MSLIFVDLPDQASAQPSVIYSLQNTAPSRPPSRTSSRSLFAGVEQAACSALGITSIKHRSALHELGCRSEIPPGLVRAVFDAISANFAFGVRSPETRSSRENWRWCRPQPQIALHNTSPEVRLERAIAAAAVRTLRGDWANQVPVASGLMHGAADRRRAIDLVHRKGVGHFELIELKVASDTPLYAAVEILGYGCAWLLAQRQKMTGLNALLDARRIDLVVLAPEAYYQPFPLLELEHIIDQELSVLGEKLGVILRFRFDRLPSELCTKALPDSDDELLGLLRQRVPLHS